MSEQVNDEVNEQTIMDQETPATSRQFRSVNVENVNKTQDKITVNDMKLLNEYLMYKHEQLKVEMMFLSVVKKMEMNMSQPHCGDV